MEKKSLKMLLNVVGAIMFLAGVIWAAVGFYLRNLPLLLILFVGGGVCSYISSKIKIVQPGEDPAGLVLPGKWKCSCGSFNDNSESFCGDCGGKRQ